MTGLVSAADRLGAVLSRPQRQWAKPQEIAPSRFGAL